MVQIVRAERAAPARVLVLSGGGGRGAFECGVIEKLSELGWAPDALVGTSIGSMNAAVWALDGTAGVIRMWETIRTRDMNRILRLRPWHSLLDRQTWHATLARFAPEERLASVTTPLYIVTTNLKTGHPVVYTNVDHEPAGPADLYQPVAAITHDHLLASSAIPYIYPKVLVNGASHWDGAVMYNSPLRPAVDCGAREIMIVLLCPYHDVNHPGEGLPPVPRGIVGKVGYLLDMLMGATFENDFEQMRKVNQRVQEDRAARGHREIKGALIGPSDWLPTLDFLRYRPDRVRALRKQGREAAVRTWQRIEQYGWDSLQR